MIAKHTLDTLEFSKVVALIRGKCLTPFGGDQVDLIAPMFELGPIERRQDEVAQMKDILAFGDAFPLERVSDCREEIEHSRIAGTFLDGTELRRVRELISLCTALTAYDKSGRDNYPCIDEYLSGLTGIPALRDAIDKAIDTDGSVKDNASAKLRQLRQNLSSERANLMSRLEKMLASRKKQAGWQDDVVTIRSDRFVITVPSSQYRSDMGILHDRSQSGATLYVEPREAVDLNNRLHMLLQEERQEVARILQELTSQIAAHADELLENIRLLGIIDCIYACASFALEIKANRPQVVDEPEFELKNARHPLLVVQMKSAEKVVPCDIALNSGRQAILITGPNTGGKTVSLKTVGLAVMMAQSGLPIAAGELSTVGIFKQVYADIGDEQSLELSLSTFSSHVRNIIQGISKADHRTLLLFDEIGAGTDPKEGAALAEAIIVDAIDRGARMLATTHYSQLKTLAMEIPELENASLEFNRDTLQPTYRLQIGLPGSSYALEIAKRLGLPDNVCEKATTLVGDKERSLSELISSLESELSEMREDRAQLKERLTNATELEKYYKTETDRLKKESEEEREKLLSDTKQFVESTRRDVERLVADIRTKKAPDETVKEFHHTTQEKLKKLNQIRERHRKEAIQTSTFDVGDHVEILTFGTQGEIAELMGKEKARIRVGSVLTVVELRNLKKLSAPQEPSTKKGAVFGGPEPTTPEIDLRGMTADEAREAIDKFIYDAVSNNMRQLYVIHGKGTGKLRSTLTGFLKKHKEVDSIRLGNWNEGGSGVTIVRLKA